ncbi:hypothetical protein C8Q80DRAFT_1121008 [Daedaleopsis nitida]|nr:hypothetical protein C8Q80DRAFT_1121008 [Daedaleopsis nitida]
MMLLPFSLICVAILMGAQGAVSESTYIRYPNETSVWYWGDRHNVSWDGTQFIIGATDPSVKLYKGDNDTGRFNLTKGHVEVTVPWVEADSDYDIRLFYVPHPHSDTVDMTASGHTSSPATTSSSSTATTSTNGTATATTSSPATTVTKRSSPAATSWGYLRGNYFTILQSPSPTTTTPLTSTDSASAMETTSTADEQNTPP